IAARAPSMLRYGLAGAIQSPAYRASRRSGLSSIDSVATHSDLRPRSSRAAFVERWVGLSPLKSPTTATSASFAMSRDLGGMLAGGAHALWAAASPGAPDPPARRPEKPPPSPASRAPRGPAAGGAGGPFHRVERPPADAAEGRIGAATKFAGRVPVSVSRNA